MKIYAIIESYYDGGANVWETPLEFYFDEVEATCEMDKYIKAEEAKNAGLEPGYASTGYFIQEYEVK